MRAKKTPMRGMSIREEGVDGRVCVLMRGMSTREGRVDEGVWQLMRGTLVRGMLVREGGSMRRFGY